MDQDQQKAQDVLNLVEAMKQAKQQELHVQNHTCWFCKKETPEDKYALHVEAKKAVRASAKSTTYSVQHHKVPRCKECAAIHNRLTAIVAGSLIAFFLPVMLGILGVDFYDISWLAIGLGWLSRIAMLVFIVGVLIYHITFPKHTHKRAYRYQFPTIQESIKQGYKYGIRSFLGL